MKVGTFRDIFSDLSTAIDKPNKEENKEKTAPNKVLLAIKHTLSNKKKNKAQALAS